MEVKVVQQSVTEVRADAIVVNLFEGVRRPGGATGALDEALGGAISDLIRHDEFRGKIGEVAVLSAGKALGARRVILVGLGPVERFGGREARKAAGAASQAARQRRFRTVASIAHGAGIGGLDPEEAARATVEGGLLGAYRFKGYKSEADEAGIREFILVERDARRLPALEAGARLGRILGEATNFARDLANEPGNFLTPRRLAEAAEETAARAGLGIEVLDEGALLDRGMGGILGVAQGSAEPPRLILLRHEPEEALSQGSVALVGKGITFDTGGISLKPREGMEEMKSDMAGGAAVLAAMEAIARLRLPVTVFGLIAAAENMPGGRALKPGDVIRMFGGKTVEVLNTDAEGRLVLADAVAYARQELGAGRIIDIATLTGAAIIALGHECGIVLGNDQVLVNEILAAGEGAGERFWQLPAYAEYRERFRSEIADLKNVGGRPAGAITGGMIIGEFAGSVSWAHLDIAGVAWQEKAGPLGPEGATGYGTRTLVELLRRAVERGDGARA